jgi:hypothetical protein
MAINYMWATPFSAGPFRFLTRFLRRRLPVVECRRSQQPIWYWALSDPAQRYRGADGACSSEEVQNLIALANSKWRCPETGEALDNALRGRSHP